MDQEKKSIPDDVKEELKKKARKDVSEIAEGLEGKIPTQAKE